MRKILFPILILAIVIGMSNCKEDIEDTEDNPITTNNPFIGTWRSIESGYHDVFTNDIVTVYRTDKSIFWKATYTYDDTFIKLVFDTTLSPPEVLGSDWGEAGCLEYRFNEEYLYLDDCPLEKCDYNFTP